MIFASDLDQTLIYSKRFLTPKQEQNKLDVRLIETLDHKEISYMTTKAIGLLKEIATRCTFIPVTTRTIEQYKRITIFQDELRPQFAITSNGGNILIKNEVVEEWSTIIRNKLDQCQAREVILNKFREIQHPEWILDIKTADDLFVYCIVDRERVPARELEHFIHYLEQNGWNSSLQGRKFYMVPRPVNKWDAVHYIKEQLGETFVIAAGDSYLDLGLLEQSNMAFIPAHGELGGTELNHSIQLAEKGILASEEILLQVYRYSHMNYVHGERS